MELHPLDAADLEIITSARPALAELVLERLDLDHHLRLMAGLGAPTDRFQRALIKLGATVEAARAIRPGHVIEVPREVTSAPTWDSARLEQEVLAAGRAHLVWITEITAADPSRMVWVAVPLDW